MLFPENHIFTLMPDKSDFYISDKTTEYYKNYLLDSLITVQ